jgi:hypothetical protein
MVLLLWSSFETLIKFMMGHETRYQLLNVFWFLITSFVYMICGAGVKNGDFKSLYSPSIALLSLALALALAWGGIFAFSSIFENSHTELPLIFALSSLCSSVVIWLSRSEEA